MKTGGDDRLDIYHTKQQTALLYGLKTGFTVSTFFCKFVKTNCVCVCQPAGLVRRVKGAGGEGKPSLKGRPLANTASMHKTINANQSPAFVAFIDLMFGFSVTALLSWQYLIKNEGIEGSWGEAVSFSTRKWKEDGVYGWFQWEVMGGFMVWCRDMWAIKVCACATTKCRQWEDEITHRLRS